MAGRLSLSQATPPPELLAGLTEPKTSYPQGGGAGGSDPALSFAVLESRFCCLLSCERQGTAMRVGSPSSADLR